MSYVKWKIENTPFSAGTWDTDNTTEIASFYDPNIRINTGDGKDSFMFKVINNSLIDDTTFTVNNKITIYRTSNTDTITTDDILMMGAIRDIPINDTGSQDIYNLKGYNFSETVMDAITFVDLENDTIPEGFQRALNQVGGANNNFRVTWSNTNPTGKTDGNPFPVIGERFFYKPLKTIIEKYSTNDRTEDGNYFWYINNNNELVWFQQDSTTLHTFDSSIDAHKTIKISKDVKGIRNYVIMRGGTDPAGNQIMDKRVDWASVGKNGMKYYMLVSENNNAKELTRLDIGGGDTNTSSYPAITASAFTTVWLATVTATVGSGTNMTAGYPVTINQGSESANKEDYTAVIRREVKSRLQKEAKTFLDLHKYGKLKTDIEFTAGSKTWGLGDRVTVTIPKLSQIDKLMRVVDIQYTDDIDTYSLEEDEGSL